MKKIITKDNILELSMISIHTFRALNAKGTKNFYEGEKFAWMSLNGIEFIVHNKEISIFLDIHKAEICFNPKTNFWSLANCSSNSRYMKIKFIHDRHKIKLENLKKMSLVELMKQSSSENDDDDDDSYDVLDSPLLIDNALDVYTPEQFNSKLIELYS